MITFIFVAFIGLLMLSFVLPVNTKSTLHGSATLIKNSILKKSNKGIVIDGQNALPLTESFRNCITIAPAGAGKTQSSLFPNILSLDHSMIITDPKGELYEIAASHLASQGFQVLVLGGLDIKNSIKYSPLQRLSKQSEIKQFAEAVYNLSNKKANVEGIWKQGAISLMEIMIQTLLNYPDPSFHNLANLIRLFYYIEDGTDKIKDFVEAYAPNQELRDRYTAFEAQEEKIRQGMVAGATTALNVFSTDEIKLLTSQDEIDFTLFRKQKTALFIQSPISVEEQFGCVLSLFYSQFFQHILNTPITPEDNSLFFFLEEFGNMKPIFNFQKTIALVRYQRVSLNMIVQNLSQIDHTYGKENSETILANSASVIAYAGIRDDRTLTFLQNLLGKATKEIITSNGVQTTGRYVMLKDEIRTMPTTEGLFIYGNNYGQKIHPLPLYKNYKLMAKANIESKYGRLYSKEPFAERFNIAPDMILSADDISYIPLDAIPEKEFIEMQQDIEQLFNNRSTVNLDF